MSNDTTEGKVWNISLSYYGEYEYHELSKSDLQEILLEEWNRRFNGIIIGRDVDCIGCLRAFFYDDKAYVAYEDFDKGQWWSSCDLGACESPGWDELVRLTPDDTQERSFIRCSIIPKDRALQIVEHYLSTGIVDGLYLSGADRKTVALGPEKGPSLILGRRRRTENGSKKGAGTDIDRMELLYQIPRENCDNGS